MNNVNISNDCKIQLIKYFAFKDWKIMSRCSTASEPSVTICLCGERLHPREWPLASGQVVQSSSGPHFSEQAVFYNPILMDSRYGKRVLSVQIAWKTWGEAKGEALAGIGKRMVKSRGRLWGAHWQDGVISGANYPWKHLWGLFWRNMKEMH